MTITAKFAGAITASGWSVQWTDTGGGPTTVNIPDGTYYVLGDDSSDDLLKVVEDAIDAIATDSPQINVSSSGVVSIAVATNTATLTWTSSGTTLRDILRFSGASQALTTTPVSGARTARYLVTTSKPTRIDTPRLMQRSSTAEADDFSRQTLTLSTSVTARQIQVRYRGPYRSSTFTEYDAWLDFFELVIRTELDCRYYPDTTVSTAYVQQSNPWGYHQGRITSPKEWIPAEVIPQWHVWLVATLDFLEV